MKVPGKLRQDVSEETLDAIALAVRESESRTSGEIVVHLVHNILPLEKPRARAIRTFFELGVDRTQRRNGVLLFVVMKKKSFEIVADEGIDRIVGAKVWDEIAERLAETIDRKGFEAGVCHGAALIGEVLAKSFPRDEGDANELPDRPVGLNPP
ncbi:MAG: TPM domain-containing protein [Vicinamibacteria bacterium]